MFVLGFLFCFLFVCLFVCLVGCLGFVVVVVVFGADSQAIALQTFHFLTNAYRSYVDMCQNVNLEDQGSAKSEIEQGARERPLGSLGTLTTS